MADVMAVRVEEAARVADLQANGRIGTVRISMARGTIFLEMFAADADDARAVIGTLPMARWWALDVFPIDVPAPGG